MKHCNTSVPVKGPGQGAWGLAPGGPGGLDVLTIYTVLFQNLKKCIVVVTISTKNFHALN